MIDVSLPQKRADYRTMTVMIDQSNSNPTTCCTYADDAVNMVRGSYDWDEFFDHRPCLFKDGKIVGYLNPNDFSKFEDGAPSDITSGNDGDVMIEFPRRGLKIYTVGDIVTISMTDDPKNPDFKYYAHQRGNVDKDYFYLGAYLGYNLSSKLRSLSGKSVTVNTTFDNFRTYARNLGTGYDVWGFYQVLFIQAMYTLKYADLNSQTVIGMGLLGSSSATTGNTNKNGMTYGTSSTSQQIKLFGLEDFWGNWTCLIDGWYLASDGTIKTVTDNFNNQGAGYNDVAKISTSISGTYISKVIGTTEAGFFTTANSGSSTTYYCDRITYGVSSGSTATVLCKIEHYNASTPDEAGVYAFWAGHDSGGGQWDCARLMYL